MSAIEEQAGRGLPARTRRWLIGFAAVIGLAGVLTVAIMLSMRAAQASRSAEADLLADFRREAAAVDAAFAPKINPDRVIWQISSPGLAAGFELAAVTDEVRAYQADNARFQAEVRSRPGALQERMAKAGFGRSRQRKLVEAFEAERNPGFATQAFLLRHELGEEVLIIAQLLERRQGAWRMAGDQLVFATNADRQLYEQAVQRQQEIQSAIPSSSPAWRPAGPG